MKKTVIIALMSIGFVSSVFSMELHQNYTNVEKKTVPHSNILRYEGFSKDRVIKYIVSYNPITSEYSGIAYKYSRPHSSHSTPVAQTTALSAIKAKELYDTFSEMTESELG